MLRHLRVAVPVLALTLLALGGTTNGQEPPKTTGEKIKEKVDGAVDSLKRGAVNAEEAIKNQYARARDAVAKMGVEGRVHARLHWDKSLVGSKVELSSPKVGVITLSGAVPDAKTRAKAVAVTTETVGVTEVIDMLTVGPVTDTPAPIIKIKP